MRHRIVLWVGLIGALLGSPAAAGPVDKPADFFIPLAGVGMPESALLFRTKKGFWQLPPARVRKGYGAAFYLVPDSRKNASVARIYIEVEPIGDLVLADAVDEAKASLGNVMAPFQTELVGDVLRLDSKKIRIGRESVLSYRLLYKVDVVTASPRTQDDTVAIMFVYKKALVTVTVENFSKDKDYMKPVLSALSIVKTPKKPKPIRVKILDAAAQIYRFITLEVPAPFRPKHRDTEYNVAATFVRADAKPDVARPQITVGRTERPRQRGMDEFANIAKYRHASQQDAYEKVGKLEPLRVAGKAAFKTTYVDKTEQGTFQVIDVLFQVREQLWVLTMEFDTADAEAASNADKSFARVLKSLHAWSGS
ncbi:MAG: hypothetical protein AAGD14_09825 [Planctomycetota bacterium]